MTPEGKVVELSAPGYGVSIAKRYANGEFGLGQGTSLSAPMVAGAAGLVWAVNPNLKAYEVKEILLQSAQRGIGECHDVGYGILDVEAAVKKAKDYPTTTVTGKTTMFKSDNGGMLGYSVEETSDGGFIIVGETEKKGKSSSRYVLKTDSELNKQWTWSKPYLMISILHVLQYFQLSKVLMVVI